MLAGAHRVLAIVTRRHGVANQAESIGPLPSMRRRRAWARSIDRLLEAVSRGCPSWWQYPHPYWDFPPLTRRRVVWACRPALLAIAATLCDQRQPISAAALRQLKSFLCDPSVSPLFGDDPAVARRAAQQLQRSFTATQNRDRHRQQAGGRPAHEPARFGVAMVNRTQALVLGFFLLAWVSLLVILGTAPEVYDQALNLPTGNRRLLELGFLAALSGFLAVLAVGVVRRWRWTFWLILVAFLFGVLRVPVAILQLRGVLAADGPAWYVVFQGLLGILQFAIGLAMAAGYRRAGVWGAR